MRLSLNNIIKKSFRLLPIKNTKILFLSHYGNIYGCNPKYISEYIVKSDMKYDCVWAFVNPDKYDIRGIRKVKYLSLRFFYELSTCRVFITNFRIGNIFIKRKGQKYIMTWHSSLRLKKIEKDAERLLPINYINEAKKDSLNIDLLISGCQYSRDIFRRAFYYNGIILESGTPRIDILFNISKIEKNKIRSSLNIREGANVLLYAPTFREYSDIDVCSIDLQKISDILKERTGGEWVVLARLHPHNRDKKLFSENNRLIDVTQYDDCQEIIAISDALVTDYSSLMFDYIYTDKPCFLYVPDLVYYTSQERELYFNIKKLPFPIARNNNELCDNIRCFNIKQYKKNVNLFMQSIGSYEDGMATERIFNQIKQWVKL